MLENSDNNKNPNKYTSTKSSSLLVLSKITANIKTGKYLNILRYISENIVFFNALIVSIFNIVTEKKTSVKMVFKISEYDSRFLKMPFIIDSLKKIIKKPKIIRLRVKIIFNILE